GADDVIDRAETGGAEKPDPRHLDGGWFRGEDLEPAVRRVAGEIDQDVDAVTADLRRNVVVADVDGRAPLVGQRPEPLRHLIRILDLGVAIDLDLPAVMRDQQRLDEMSDGVAAKVRRDIADAQAPLR